MLNHVNHKFLKSWSGFYMNIRQRRVDCQTKQHSKRNHKQNEKTTYRMGENIANNATNKGLISKIYKQLI